MRIRSIDILRGLTIGAMILVNNGGGPENYAPLEHSVWNGLTICDMVFPTFLFLVGITTYLSLSKTYFALTRDTVVKVAKRTLWILLVGWTIHYVEYACKGDLLPWAHFRVTGVLTRIALCYFLTAMIALTCRREAIPFIITALLAGYGVLLLLGNGYSMEEDSLLVAFDRAVLRADHLYLKKPVDPEGLLSTVSALAHTLTGFCIGKILVDKESSAELRLLKLMAWGFALLCAGYALDQLLPINKRIWSPSYLLVSCGYASLALGALGYVVDVKGQQKWCWPLEVFGCNPMFLYALSEVVTIVMSATGAKRIVYQCFENIAWSGCAASATYAALMVLTMWLCGVPLYKKKIYIKL